MGLWSRRRGHDSADAGSADEVADAVPIAEVVPRLPVVVVGQVTRMRARPASGEPSLVVTVSDDTGAPTVVWTGRRSIGGVTLGRRLAVEGVPRAVGHGLEMTNPAYTLLP